MGSGVNIITAKSPSPSVAISSLVYPIQLLKICDIADMLLYLQGNRPKKRQTKEFEIYSQGEIYRKGVSCYKHSYVSTC